MAANLSQESSSGLAHFDHNSIQKSNARTRALGVLITFVAVSLFFSMQSLLMGSTKHLATALLVGVVISPVGYFIAAVMTWLTPKRQK